MSANYHNKTGVEDKLQVFPFSLSFTFLFFSFSFSFLAQVLLSTLCLPFHTATNLCNCNYQLNTGMTHIFLQNKIKSEYIFFLPYFGVIVK